MFKVKDIMTTHVVAVSADDTVDLAISLMVKHRISGLPVLDEHGLPIGIVSEYDLMGLVCSGGADDVAVRAYTSDGLFSVAEDDRWVAAADMFRHHHVRRLPVLRDGRLVGIVTRHDFVHAIRDARQQLRRRIQDRSGGAAVQTDVQSFPSATPVEHGA